MRKPATICTLLITSMLVALPAFAQDGSGSHGGDTLANEFEQTLYQLDAALTPDYQDSCPLLNEVHDMVRTIHFDSKPFVFVKDPETGMVTENDFANFFIGRVPEISDLPEKLQTEACMKLKDREEQKRKCQARIRISRTRRPLLTDTKALLIMHLHEVYGLLGLETTNKTPHSSACITSLEKKRGEIKSLIYHEPVVTSMEKLFASGEGRFYFDCVSGIDHYRIYTEYSPALRAQLNGTYSGYLSTDFYRINIDQLGGDNQLTRISSYRSPNLTPETMLNLFSRSYSLEEGMGTIHFSVTLSAGSKLSLVTEDHLAWKAVFTAKGKEQGRSFEALCTPTTLVRFDQKYGGGDQ